MDTIKALIPAAATGPVATPENTPKPGGGSWSWDEATGGWAENPPYSHPPLTTPETVPAMVPASVPATAPAVATTASSATPKAE